VAPSGLPLTLPLALRNRLAALILDSLHDAHARRILDALAGRREPTLGEWRAEDREHLDAVVERAARAVAAVSTRPQGFGATELREALADAAVLFDAGLYFEVHELLEPHWVAATGAVKDALQGLIQIAVGYQHLANGNLAGARALLDDGSAKIAKGIMGRLGLDRFAGAVRGSITRVGGEFDWTEVPKFPRTKEGNG
jgi:hypothetical protein